LHIENIFCNYRTDSYISSRHFDHSRILFHMFHTGENIISSAILHWLRYGPCMGKWNRQLIPITTFWITDTFLEFEKILTQLLGQTNFVRDFLSMPSVNGSILFVDCFSKNSLKKYGKYGTEISYL
jgi:hypothetical protein